MEVGNLFFLLSFFPTISGDSNFGGSGIFGILGASIGEAPGIKLNALFNTFINPLIPLLTASIKYRIGLTKVLSIQSIILLKKLKMPSSKS